MRRVLKAWTVVGAILAVLQLSGLAAETTVYTTDQLRNTLNAARPGDRIYVAPGNYNQLLWVQNVHGVPGNLIEVVALDPTDRPVFEEGSSAVFTFYNCSYISVDGMIVQGAGTATQDGNNIMFTFSDHMVLRNSVSRDIVHTGNSDGTKFNSSDNVLMYNCTISEWGEAGSAMDGMISNSDLFMRNTITFPSLATGASANGIMPKGAAYHHGMYKNLFLDGSSRAVCFGGSGGATGPEIRDSVAMGNVIVGGEAAVAFCSATTCEFAYNTVVDPEKWVMRVQKEGAYETDNCIFRRNLVRYGPLLPYGGVQGTGGTVHPETFTYEANYWYRSDNPAASIPSLPGGEIDPAGGVNPQLDADYRPLYGPAKTYGAHAAEMEAEFEQYTPWFQWAWDQAMQYEPDADAGGPYDVGPGGIVTFDAGGSYAGSGAYDDDPSHPEWHQRITSCQWDLDGDGVFDDAAGAAAAVDFEDLTGDGPGQLHLGFGRHGIELRMEVSTAYGTMVDWGRGELLILPGLPGDANLDDEVGIADLSAVADNYGQPGGWIEGDFNFDGVVGIADLSTLADHYGETAGNAVPEPVTLSLLLPGLALIRRRGRPTWRRAV